MNVSHFLGRDNRKKKKGKNGVLCAKMKRGLGEQAATDMVNRLYTPEMSSYN
jgi:hypothetical protein